MMKSMSKTLASKVMSFAHLAGMASKAEGDGPKDDKKEQDHENGDVKKSKAEGDDREKRDDETDDEYAARMASMDDDEEAEGDDPEKKDGDEKDSKAKKAEEDDKDEEMRGGSTAAKARLREQARCATIFGSAAAANNPVLAANLAFKTRMSRTEALAVLEGTPAPARASASNPSRAARNPGIAAGGAASVTGSQAAAASLDRAFAKANPKRK